MVGGAIMDTPNEICRSYRMAKNKRKQIQIIAELNGVSREEIIKILVRRAGAAVPGRKEGACRYEL